MSVASTSWRSEICAHLIARCAVPLDCIVELLNSEKGIEQCLCPPRTETQTRDILGKSKAITQSRETLGLNGGCLNGYKEKKKVHIYRTVKQTRILAVSTISQTRRAKPWRAIDLVPMGKKVLVANPARRTVARLNDCPLTASRYRSEPKSSSLTKTAAHYTLSRTML